MLSHLDRTQRLEKVQKVLSEDILKLEENEAVLKSMEKDLTVCHFDSLGLVVFPLSLEHTDCH